MTSNARTLPQSLFPKERRKNLDIHVYCTRKSEKIIQRKILIKTKGNLKTVHEWQPKTKLTQNAREK